MNRLYKKICFLLSVLFLIGLTGCGKEVREVEIPEITETVATEPKMQSREGVQTILVLCLDDYEEALEAGGFRNASRADFAMLMVIDERNGSITSLQLNSDTEVPFVVPGTPEAQFMPLGQIFSYGSGGSDSCLYVTKAVSKLLKGIAVDHYLTFTKDAIGIVNDMIGGVTVPAEENPEETVTLSGAEAMEFFFARGADDVSNEKHMEKQRQYMGAMFRPFMISAQNEDFLTKLSLKLGEGMSTGLTLSQMLQMFDTMAAYAMDENILTIPGSAYNHDGQIRFVVDEQAVDQILETLFPA